ncbi:DUF5399 family protein [Candidatus Chlamydia sanziniae]|uniref:Uncharacterized protein n=1 Tax=Candidatus Chlamydia sanziniae TaxID=1806891 RepID=A0A1A9HYN7_9CHLA|nr:DUF5399 family protein [Candidatus Chlamydia sanziniae]ANH79154.1 hypothetical protein Cs308_0984 [Candidatus Chlamydia sanziniae]
MVEIFNYSASIYEKHAADNRLVNDFRKEVQMEGITVRDIAKHAQILDMTPKPSALIALLQTNQKTHWALFTPPNNFYTQRFSTPYLAPSLGSPDQQDQDIEKISAFLKVLTRGKFSYRSRVTPFLSYRDKEEEAKENSDKESAEDQEEDSRIQQGKVLIKALDLGIKSTNVMIDYVISRIFQFVQG